jgi:predicted nucleotidyltransferase
MMSVQEKHLDMLKNILNLYVSSCEIRAFGSRVKGTNRKYSDLDLAVVGNGKLDERLFWKLKNALMESRLPFRVDILDYNAVSENFRKVIDSNYEII